MRVVVDPDLRHNFVYRTTDLPMKRAFNAYSQNKKTKKNRRQTIKTRQNCLFNICGKTDA